VWRDVVPHLQRRAHDAPALVANLAARKNGPRFSLSSAAFEHLIRGSFVVDAHMH
jgi:hypothetical protein